MRWQFDQAATAPEQRCFADPVKTLSLRGDLINDSKTNFTQRVELGGKRYYIKRYHKAGQNLRRYVGRSRVHREWRNAGWFARNDIPTPRRVVMGEANRWSGDYWGVIISEEAPQTTDLKRIFEDHPERLRDRPWRLAMLLALAGVVAAMHGKRFIHNDLHSRNLLVSFDQQPRIYVIDCPAGRHIYLLGNRRGVVRDLALLDRMGKQALSRTDRLRFYLWYRGHDRLQGRDKQEIRRIVGFLGD